MARNSIKIGKALWAAQIVLAVIFLFAGGFKLALPAAELAKQPGPLSVDFIKFIGVCEVAGALGLVLPGIFGIRRELTPLAATGLVIIMVGAVVSTIATGPAAGAVVPAVVGLLAAYVARKHPARHARTTALVASAASA
jgi:hypothetical protein